MNIDEFKDFILNNSNEVIVDEMVKQIKINNGKEILNLVDKVLLKSNKKIEDVLKENNLNTYDLITAIKHNKINNPKLLNEAEQQLKEILKDDINKLLKLQEVFNQYKSMFFKNDFIDEMIGKFKILENNILNDLCETLKVLEIINKVEINENSENFLESFNYKNINSFNLNITLWDYESLDEWSEQIKKYIIQGDNECEWCKNNVSELDTIYFIYKTHKYDWYRDSRKLCKWCIQGFVNRKIPNPCDYNYKGILKDNVYEVDIDYYLKNHNTEYIDYYTNVHWNELNGEMQDKLKYWKQDIEYYRD